MRLRLHVLAATIAALPACSSTSAPLTILHPPARWLAGMVYDEAHHVVLLYGGENANGFLGDMWKWDGVSWTEITTSPNPGLRDPGIMVYDSARQRVVLHGGAATHATPTLLTDTWEWNGNSWSQITATPPPPRAHASGGYDRIRKKVVMYGGETTSNVPMYDTWTWDGATWTQAAATSPSALRLPSAMAWIASRGTLMQISSALNSQLAEAWEWNGTAWSLVGALPAIGSPNSLVATGPNAAFVARDRVSGTNLMDALTWDGTSWTAQAVVSPSFRYGASAVFFPPQGIVVLFGGYTGSAYYDDTYTWNGAAWAKQP